MGLGLRVAVPTPDLTSFSRPHYYRGIYFDLSSSILFTFWKDEELSKKIKLCLQYFCCRTYVLPIPELRVGSFQLVAVKATTFMLPTSKYG